MVQVKYLDEDWQSHKKFPSFFEHLVETIKALGGIQGLSLIGIGLLLFYLYVLHVVSSRHLKRSSRKR